jgi:hypothetical protein
VVLKICLKNNYLEKYNKKFYKTALDVMLGAVFVYFIFLAVRKKNIEMFWI